MTKAELVTHTLNIDYPGHDLESAIAETGNRQQNAYEKLQRLDEEKRRLQYEIDHAERDFSEATAHAELFYDYQNEEDSNDGR